MEAQPGNRRVGTHRDKCAFLGIPAAISRSRSGFSLLSVPDDVSRQDRFSTEIPIEPIFASLEYRPGMVDSQLPRTKYRPANVPPPPSARATLQPLHLP